MKTNIKWIKSLLLGMVCLGLACGATTSGAHPAIPPVAANPALQKKVVKKRVKKKAKKAPAKPAKPPVAIAQAQVGLPAPHFVLPDLEGKLVDLAKLKGKIVVLEWFSPTCPFVRTAHERSFSIKGKAVDYKDKNVVWLAVNSAKIDTDKNSIEMNKSMRSEFGFDYPILRDDFGNVGRLYGAKKTPHLFVIDGDGVLVFRGAIDNTSGGDLDDADPPPAQNYVDRALKSVIAKEPVHIQQTTAWG